MGFYDDIRQQSVGVRRLVGKLSGEQSFAGIVDLGDVKTSRVVFSGMGASYFATYHPWMRMAAEGRDCHRLECAELLYHGLGLLTEDSILVLVSQSGESIEVRRLVEKVRQDFPKTKIVSVTNSSNNYLASHADCFFSTDVGDEVGVATKSFTTSIILLDWLVDKFLGNNIQESLREALWLADDMETVIRENDRSGIPDWRLLKDARCFYVLGRGEFMAAAHDGALVFSETCQLPGIAMHSSQFRHGPMEAVSRTNIYFILAGDDTTNEVDVRLAQDIHERGGRVRIIGDSSLIGRTGSVPLWTLPSRRRYMAILSILPIQIVAGGIAESQGFVPGKFRFGGKVVLAE